MNALLAPCALLSLLLSGGIFGFFYAWVCSTMWGLDSATPQVAIAAMQAMNASVRNLVFAPAFFGTPFALALTAWLAWRSAQSKAAAYFLAAALIYTLGALLVTLYVNVPMNQALATLRLPMETAEAQRVWSQYSILWQQWNLTRTIASGTSLLATGLAFLHLRGRPSR